MEFYTIERKLFDDTIQIVHMFKMCTGSHQDATGRVIEDFLEGEVDENVKKWHKNEYEAFLKSLSEIEPQVDEDVDSDPKVVDKDVDLDPKVVDEDVDSDPKVEPEPEV